MAAGIADEPCDVPVNRTHAGVLKIVPDEPVAGTQKGSYRRVSMDGLHGERTLEDRGAHLVEAGAQQFPSAQAERRRWGQLDEKSVQPVTDFAELPELAWEARQCIV